MAEFRPFSLADSLNAATGAAANTLTLRHAQNQMAGEQVFRDTARRAVVPAQAASAAPVQSMPMSADPINQGAPLPPGGIPMAAGAPMSQGAQAISALFQKETAGHQKGYNPEYHAQLLEEEGYPDRALAVRELADKRKGSKLGMQTQVLDFVARAAPLVTDQQSLDALRGGLQAVGLDPQMIPAQFTPDTQQALQVLGMGAAKQVELMFKQMTLAETGRHNRAMETLREREVKDKEKSGGTNKAKEQAELEAQGMPKPLAHAIAYDLVERVQSPLGLETNWRNKSTNEVVATQSMDGKLSPGPGWKRLMGDTAPSPSAPAPAAGGSVPPPESRVVNQVYQTPRGPMIWTGTGWIPAGS